MHDNQHIVKYNVKFNHLAICTGWDEGVLWHCYYSGLTSIADKLGKDRKLTLQERQRCFDNNLVHVLWQPPATLQKIVWNPRHLPLKPKPKPSKPKAKKPKNPWIRKKTEQSPALCTAWGLCWLFLCPFWGCPTQHIRSFWSQLSPCFPDSPLISDSSLHVSALIDPSYTHCFVDTSFVQYYKLPTYSVDPIELKLFDGTSNSVITQSVAVACKISIWWMYEC